MLGLAILLMLNFQRLHFVMAATITEQDFLYGANCTGSGNYTANSRYQYLLYNLLGSFISDASITGFNHSSLAQTPDQVYGLYMCRGDVTAGDCTDCIIEAKDKILQECPYQTSATIWYNTCMIRYSEQSFYGQVAYDPWIMIINVDNITGNQTRFSEILENTLIDLAILTANDSSGTKMFGTKVVKVSDFVNLYALGQCTLDLTADGCSLCLKRAIGVQVLYVKQGGLVLLPSCNVRYEIYPFFDSPSPPLTNATVTNDSGRSTHAKDSTKRKVIYFIIAISLAMASLLVFGTWICIQKKKANSERSNLQIDDIKTMEALQFDLSRIKAATRNFSVDNKLGEGGFGAVYKGILDDGQEVALKRLSKNSGQGILEFKTEIVLLAELRHKNLVKLLGFCLASKEKILVYEYLPNSSLDQSLFDPSKKNSLDWEVRFKIIVGIAKGLLYLHEDSRLKIIHRDLKSSNILLDESMNPKISDFGLAKLFGVDETQGDTKRIVGTYGYMAPEYAMTGHFSVKSDVYSYGVLVLEIVSGLRNRFFGREQVEEALLHRAWRLWNERTPLNLVDISLGNNYPREEVTKCIHIGLLCIQENAVERPRMASIVAALNGQSISLPMPKSPHFFGDLRNTDISPALYNQLMVGNEIEYHHKLDVEDYPYIYTGTGKITDMYPR